MGGRQREGKRDRAAVSGVWDEVLTPKSGRGTELCCGQWSPGGRGAEGGGGGRGEPRAALWMWERAECRGTKTYQECRVDLFFSLSPPPPLVWNICFANHAHSSPYLLPALFPLRSSGRRLLLRKERVLCRVLRWSQGFWGFAVQYRGFTLPITGNLGYPGGASAHRPRTKPI